MLQFSAIGTLAFVALVTRWGIATHPLFSRIHEDPRWQAFVEKAGQSPEQLALIEFELELPGNRETTGI